MGPRFSVSKLNNLITAFAVLVSVPLLAQETTSGQWQTACVEGKCTATPVARPSPGFGILVYKIDETPIIEVITPLGINLQTGVGLLVDEKTTFPTKLLSCELDGCRAFTTLTPKLLSAMKRGLIFEVVVQTSKSREVLAFEYSLDGFTKAFDEIQ